MCLLSQLGIDGSIDFRTDIAVARVTDIGADQQRIFNRIGCNPNVLDTGRRVDAQNCAGQINCRGGDILAIHTRCIRASGTISTGRAISPGLALRPLVAWRRSDRAKYLLDQCKGIATVSIDRASGRRVGAQVSIVTDAIVVAVSLRVGTAIGINSVPVSRAGTLVSGITDAVIVAVFLRVGTTIGINSFTVRRVGTLVNIVGDAVTVCIRWSEGNPTRGNYPYVAAPEGTTPATLPIGIPIANKDDSAVVFAPGGITGPCHFTNDTRIRRSRQNQIALISSRCPT